MVAFVYLTMHIQIGPLIYSLSRELRLIICQTTTLQTSYKKVHTWELLGFLRKHFKYISKLIRDCVSNVVVEKVGTREWFILFWTGYKVIAACYIYKVQICVVFITIYLCCASLVYMIKGGGENESALLILLIFFFFLSHKSNLSLDNKNLKWGKYHYEINVFLKYTLDTIIGTPRNSYEQNIAEVYSHSYSQFWALQGDCEHTFIQPWLPVSQKNK